MKVLQINKKEWHPIPVWLSERQSSIVETFLGSSTRLTWYYIRELGNNIIYLTVWVWGLNEFIYTNTRSKAYVQFKCCFINLSPKGYVLLLLSCVSRVRLCATPQTAAHQASLSLGFSRQEHWSGLPFPSPRRESETWNWSPRYSIKSCQVNEWMIEWMMDGWMDGWIYVGGWIHGYMDG